MLNLILFGPPGSGKGTQAEKLIDKYDLVHISTGDLLRSELDNKTPLGLEAKKYMDDGLLVPDEVVIGMIQSRLEHMGNERGVIFDGFPRTIDQAQALDNLLSERSEHIHCVIALQVSPEELTKRILLRGKDSGRADDANEEIIRQRISEYEQKTSLVGTHYEQGGAFKTIKGEGSVEEIFGNITTVIDNLN